MTTPISEKLVNLKNWMRLAPTWLKHGSPLKMDEDLRFFPTSATQQLDGSWDIPVHAWFYELDQTSLMRLLSVKAVSGLLEFMDITEEQARLPVFQERIKWFLVDNESNKRIELRLNKQTFKSARTGLDGHSHFNIKLDSIDQMGQWIDIPVVVPEGDKRQFSAKSQLIPRKGLSVISDIDDTIKTSDVLDKKKLVQNTFLKEYTATDGMPAFYQWLSNEGAYFHYLSSSPWQMHPMLEPFLDNYYPKGAVHLRNFNPSNRSFFKFFMSSEVYKITKALNSC